MIDLMSDPVPDYPAMIAAVNPLEPAPRRVRAMLGGEVVFDTTQALYVWEWPNYPWYYIPLADIDAAFIVDEDHPQRVPQGAARRHGLLVGEVSRPKAARVFQEDSLDGLAGTVRFDWNALDAWFEEDEEIFVHPRNPYTRVDALRSTRHVRIELDGLVLAESEAAGDGLRDRIADPLLLRPQRGQLRASSATETVTSCPYKGQTSGYWSVLAGDEVHADLAWSYEFPTRQLPIAGLVSFYDEGRRRRRREAPSAEDPLLQ